MPLVSLYYKFVLKFKFVFRTKCLLLLLLFDNREILRRFRSCMNYWSNKYAGSKSKLDDFASDDIGGNSILPLYTNKSGKRLKNENISRTATITTKAGRTSLFVMTFVILIWTMMVPLPKLSLLGYGKPIINETDFKQANLRVFPGIFILFLFILIEQCLIEMREKVNKNVKE